MTARRAVTKTGGWAEKEILTAAQATAIDAAAAAGVANAATTGGDKVMPLVFSGASLGDSAEVYTSGGKHYFTNNAATSQWELVGLPHGHILDQVSIFLKPAGGHAADPAQPAQLPKVEVFKVDSAGAATSFGSSTYAWVDKATYEHANGIYIGLDGMVEVIDLSTYRYVVELTHESGANSVTGIQLKSIVCNLIVDTTEDFSFWR